MKKGYAKPETSFLVRLWNSLKGRQDATGRYYILDDKTVAELERYLKQPGVLASASVTARVHDDGSHWIHFVASNGKQASIHVETHFPHTPIVREALVQWVEDRKEKP